jgi:hypothetical protein
MTEPTEQSAPALGSPTDSAVGAEAIENASDEKEPGPVDELAEPDRTMDTPDELGGTGGDQAGGAG